eukprot:8363243-Alexandrium_andersonii.AAC.1
MHVRAWTWRGGRASSTQRTEERPSEPKGDGPWRHPGDWRGGKAPNRGAEQGRRWGAQETGP